MKQPCYADKLSPNAKKKLNRLLDFLTGKWRAELEEEIEKILSDLDPECVHTALYHLALLRRFYIARQSGWAYVLATLDNECLKLLPEDAEIHKKLKTVIIPDQLREGKGAEFEGCLRKKGVKFIKLAWVGW